MNGRKSTRDYWENEWSRIDAPRPIDPRDSRAANLLYRALDRDFRNILGKCGVQKGASFLEIGCGGSRWLPYFHNEFGFRVSGIDYTDTGVTTAKEIARQAGIDAVIVKGDAFDLPGKSFADPFDVVASFGFIEHFDDTAHAVRQISQFLKPNGVLISTIPNMVGAYGSAYKWLKPALYNIHKPLSLTELVEAHRDAGLEVIDSGYVLSTPGVSVGSPPAGSDLIGLTKRAVRLVSSVTWALEARGIAPPKSQLLSPHMKCFARRPA